MGKIRESEDVLPLEENCKMIMPIRDIFTPVEIVKESEPQVITEIVLDPGKFQANSKNVFITDRVLRDSVPLGESKKMERGDLLSLLEDSFTTVLDRDPQNLPQNLAALRDLAQRRGEIKDGEARSSIDERLRDDFDKVISLVAERVYWKTLLARQSDDTLLSNASDEIKNDIHEIKIRDGGLPSEIGQKFIYFELNAGKLEDKFIIWGIPSNYDFRFGADSRLSIFTQDQYLQINNQNSVFDRILVPTIITRVLGPAAVAVTSLFCVLPSNLPIITPTSSPESTPLPQATATETPVPLPNAVEIQIQASETLPVDREGNELHKYKLDGDFLLLVLDKELKSTLYINTGNGWIELSGSKEPVSGDIYWSIDDKLVLQVDVPDVAGDDILLYYNAPEGSKNNSKGQITYKVSGNSSFIKFANYEPNKNTKDTEVKMTLESWKKALSGSYISERGDVYPDLGIIFSSEFSQILTDPEEIRALQAGTEKIVLNITPVITVWMENEEAALRAEQGAIILVPPPGHKADVLAQFGLIGAKKLSIDNDKQNDIQVEFGESSSEGLPWGILMQFGDGSGGRTIPVKITSNGRYISPLVSKPLHFVPVDPVTGEEVSDLEGLDDPVFWADSIVKAGYNILIKSSGFSTFSN